MPKRIIAFLGLLFFCILTLWVPGYWPVAVFVSGAFALAVLEVLRGARGSRVAWLFAALPAWGVVQLLMHWTVYREPTRIGIVATLSYACVVFIISGIPARGVDGARLAMLWFAFVVAVVATVLNAALPAYADVSRMGPILYHNHWAVFVEVTLPLALYYALRSRGGSVWLYATMAATLYASVVISASRSGVIVCTAELAAVPLLMRRGGRVLAAVLGVLVLCTLIVGPEAVIKRLREDPTIMRADWDRSSLVMLREHWAHGVGLGNWPVVYPQYATLDIGRYVNQAHNDWLQWGVEGGIFYAGAWVAIAAISWRQAWRHPWAVGVPAVFLQALMDYPFSRPAVAGWTLTVLGLAMASERDK